jgi:sigma-E factor negative regulatory protein RseA
MNMTQETEGDAELLSALVDGQLCGEEFANTIEWLGQEEGARLTWHAYHLVGDVLRSGESMVGFHDIAFLQRLKHGLRDEARIVPHPGVVNLVPTEPLKPDSRLAKPSEHRAANDFRGGWKMLAGLASLAAIMVIGWQLIGGFVDQPDAQQAMIRDPQLDALLAAHRQSGGTSALQMSAGFLRNATFEGTSR